MSKRIIRILSILSLLLPVAVYTASAQSGDGDPLHKIMMGGVVVGKDTFPLGYIPTVFIDAQPMTEAELNKLRQLRYNVAKVYPYAVTAAYILNRVDSELATTSKKRYRKAYLRATQKALKKQFKGELKNLTINQGQILVKLIDRETGRNCYDVIKELRGGLRARLSQTAAFLFHNDLKARYDPTGADRDIELIVEDIEAKQYFQYQSHIMEQKASALTANHKKHK